MLRPPPGPTPFPYTTLFRSMLLTLLALEAKAQHVIAVHGRRLAEPDPAALAEHRFLAPQHHLPAAAARGRDRKSTRLNSSHITISYAVFCLKKKRSTWP